MKKIVLLSVLMIGIGNTAEIIASTANQSSQDPQLTVFTAKKIITMDTSAPNATAVAVANGKIVSVGSLKSLKPWTSNREVIIDHTLKEKGLMPGFIDPHVHPSLPAILSQFPFIAPEHWSLPTGEFPAAKTNKEYIEKYKGKYSEGYQVLREQRLKRRQDVGR